MTDAILKKPLKILIIFPAWVGDMVMAQSLLSFLKAQDSSIVIDGVAPKSTYLLAQRMPEINQVYSLEVTHGGMQWAQRWQLGKKLRANEYDQAIVLPNSWKSALVPFFANIKKRTGWRGELRYFLLNDVRILNKSLFPLMIERFCALGIAKDVLLPYKLPWPKLKFDVENQARLREKFHLFPTVARPSQLDLENQPENSCWNYQSFQKVLAICPGAEYGLSKRWPPEYFAAVAQSFLNQSGQVWILGGPKDQEVADKIQEICNHACINLVGKTNLLDAIDILAMASVTLTNDSGLMHISAAVETPLVAIYGSTTPNFTPPLANQAAVISLNTPCSPCFERTCRFGDYHCLTGISPDEVITAVNQLVTLNNQANP